LAVPSLRCRVIASIAASHACVPPGASKNTDPRAKAGKRARTASIGKSGINQTFALSQEKRASILPFAA
jgi:hypothetical protein